MNLKNAKRVIRELKLLIEHRKESYDRLEVINRNIKDDNQKKSLRVKKLEKELEDERANLGRVISALIYANQFIKSEQEALIVYRTEALRNLGKREEDARKNHCDTELALAE